MSPRDQMIKMQRIILRQLKSEIARYQGEVATDLLQYQQTYSREFRTFQKISSKKELITQAKKADVIFGGDFHPFSQSQRTHLRILRELVRGGKPMVLALEAFQQHHQKYLDQYLAGKISENVFLKKIHYKKNWGFPWENYKVLLEFAKDRHIQVAGLNSPGQPRGKGELEVREARSARRIAQLHRKNNQSKIYVVYGDWHLSQSKLPKLTRKYFGAKKTPQMLTITQNSETLYWKLVKKNLEEVVDVLKIHDDAYCVLNSPPWLKWQSYLHFLENKIDDQVDHSDHIYQWIGLIKDFWGIKGRFHDFEVFEGGDGSVAKTLQRRLSPAQFSWCEKLIKNNKSFFVPGASIFYLSAFGVNTATSLAGQYVHAKMRNEKHMHCQFPSDFAGAIWIEAIGFLASKIINSKRKYKTVDQLPPRHQVRLLVIEQKLREEMSLRTGKKMRQVSRSSGRKAMDYDDAARILGSQMGEKLFEAFLSDHLKPLQLQKWLRKSINQDTLFMGFYMSVVRALKDRAPITASHKERL